MISLGRTTRKRYYEEPYLSRCKATVVKIAEGSIELDATLAYPEGGGQEADSGYITLPEGRRLRFVGAKKLYTDRIFLPDFPDIQTRGVIQHLIDAQEPPWIDAPTPGEDVIIEIDVERRARLALSHTASHLLYVAVGMVRPDAVASTLGCHIKEHGARFDFGVQERFSTNQLQRILDAANELVARASRIDVVSHPGVPDAHSWKCDNHTILCGGMHISNTAQIGFMTIRRKALGSGKERISCEFPYAVLDLGPYRAER